jgi:hypothetical protein
MGPRGLLFLTLGGIVLVIGGAVLHADATNDLNRAYCQSGYHMHNCPSFWPMVVTCDMAMAGSHCVEPIVGVFRLIGAGSFVVGVHLLIGILAHLAWRWYLGGAR